MSLSLSVNFKEERIFASVKPFLIKDDNDADACILDTSILVLLGWS